MLINRVISYTVYIMYILSTTIRVSRRTKDLLTRVLIELENDLGRRLDYDDVIRILIEKSKVKKPELLLKLNEMSVSEEIAREARKLLEEEKRSEERFF